MRHLLKTLRRVDEGDLAKIAHALIGAYGRRPFDKRGALFEAVSSLPIPGVRLVSDNELDNNPGLLEHLLRAHANTAFDNRGTYLCVFDGMHGAGKGRIRRALQNRFLVDDPQTDVAVIRESEWDPLAKSRREYLATAQHSSSGVNEGQVLAYISAGRHIMLVGGGFEKKCLQDPNITFVDRSVVTTILKQAAAGTSLAWAIQGPMSSSYLAPDNMVVLYCDPEVSKKRQEAREGDADAGQKTPSPQAVNLKNLQEEYKLVRSLEGRLPKEWGPIFVDTTSDDTDIDSHVRAVVDELYPICRARYESRMKFRAQYGNTD